MLACTKTGKPQNGKLPLDFERQEMAGVGKAAGRGGGSQRISVESQLFLRHFSLSSRFFWGKEFQDGLSVPSPLYAFQTPTPVSYFLSFPTINIPPAFHRSREMDITD